ncbi:hypothetical protein VE02_09576 [Pseudogymnoascus sp. 03VT05]|nr:hypothetical protein VE02_09576 [Pseudogymnoascus sp. 03VT05]
MLPVTGASRRGTLHPRALIRRKTLGPGSDLYSSKPLGQDGAEAEATRQGGLLLPTDEGSGLPPARHNLLVAAVDSNGELKASRHDFVACDFEELDVSLILGYPWLAAVDPMLGFRAGTWRYAKQAAGIEVLEPEEFYRETEGLTVYCVHTQERLGALRISVVSSTAFENETVDVIPEDY